MVLWQILLRNQNFATVSGDMSEARKTSEEKELVFSRNVFEIYDLLCFLFPSIETIKPWRIFLSSQKL